ncbi:MAG: 4-hydroxy-tetrahydrodipicolinate reductase [Oscillospiraceae bacterium]|jgi:4-hydroxy-tetrahydrodipicolinate reductase|nr:4-hydroxy-tetrahydrodipicolinate reductase [Oscillospiraceae bacterium]
MTKIILSGAAGKMGKAICAVVAERTDCEIVAGIDRVTDTTEGFQIFEKPSDITVDADVIIDFSHPSALQPLLAYAKDKQLPAVIATTGLSEEQVRLVTEASEVIPVFYSGNMSLGINLLIALARKATAVLDGSFDIEIIEKHHNQKIDAPSGTALMIADAIRSQRSIPSTYEFDRHSVRRKRERSEIGIHSVRGGTIVGEHEVIFAGHNEVLSLTHKAEAKGVFAGGAVNAALYISKVKPGLYDMNDLITNAD